MELEKFIQSSLAQIASGIRTSPKFATANNLEGWANVPNILKLHFDLAVRQSQDIKSDTLHIGVEGDSRIQFDIALKLDPKKGDDAALLTLLP